MAMTKFRNKGIKFLAQLLRRKRITLLIILDDSPQIIYWMLFKTTQSIKIFTALCVYENNLLALQIYDENLVL